MRFALLRHFGSPDGDHTDLFFEDGERLFSLKAEGLPLELIPGTRMRLKRQADHRLIYLDYEGPISGGRGEVRAIDRGDYQRLSGRSFAGASLALQGLLWRGVLELRELRADDWELLVSACALRGP